MEPEVQNATKKHALTYDDLLVRGIELGAKCDPSKSWANHEQYRASWLGLLASDGWTEDEWFKAATPWGN